MKFEKLYYNGKERPYRKLVDKNGNVVFPELFYYENGKIAVRQFIPNSKKDISFVLKARKENHLNHNKKAVIQYLKTIGIEDDNFIWLIFNSKENFVGMGQFKYSYEENIAYAHIDVTSLCTNEDLLSVREAFKEIGLFDNIVVENIEIVI